VTFGAERAPLASFIVSDFERLSWGCKLWREIVGSHRSLPSKCHFTACECVLLGVQVPSVAGGDHRPVRLDQVVVFFGCWWGAALSAISGAGDRDAKT
jgi:hypothetical protein